MFVWFAKLVVNAVALILTARIVSGIRIEDFGAALVAVLVVAILNTLVRPILFFLTLPVTILTLGLFVFVLNAILFLLASSITPGLSVDGFGSALVGSIVYSLLSSVLLALLR